MLGGYRDGGPVSSKWGRRLLFLLLGLLMAICGPPAVAAAGPHPGRIFGQVLDDVTGEPLPQAEVVVLFAWGTDWGTKKRSSIELKLGVDGQGRFAGDVPPEVTEPVGVYLHVQAVGHRGSLNGKASGGKEKAISLAPGEHKEIPVRLQPGVTLAGRITDPSGKPLGGAAIRVFAAGPLECTELAWQGGLYSWPPTPVSGPDGTWRFLDVDLNQMNPAKATHLILMASHDFFPPQMIEKVEQRAPTAGEISADIQMKPGRAVVGVVRDQQGQPLVRAEISIREERLGNEPRCFHRHQTVWTDQSGQFAFVGQDLRHYFVKAKADGFEPSHQEQFQLEPGKAPLRLYFQLKPGLSFSGRLVNEEGTSLAEKRIWLSLPLYEGETISDQNGSFQFRGVPCGEGTLGVQPLFRKKMTFPAPPQDIIVPLGRELILRLVQAEDGQPLAADAEIETCVPGGWSKSSWRRGDHHLSLGKMPPGGVTVRVAATGRIFKEEKFELEPANGKANELTIELEQGFTLKGRVTDRRGKPLEGAEVRVFGVNERSGWHAKADSAGRYEISGLSPKQFVVGNVYRISASKPGYGTEHNFELFFRKSVFERVIDFELEPGGSIKGRIILPDGKPASEIGVFVRVRGFRLRTLVEASYSGATDADGRFCIEGLPAGKVAVTASAGSGEKELEIEAGKVTELEWRLGR